MADGRQGSGRGAVGEFGSMVGDAVMSVAERVVRPSGDGGEPAPTATRPPTRRGRSGGAGAVAHLGGPGRAIGEVAGAVVGRIAPSVIEHIDVNATLQRVDVNSVLEQVNVNKVLARRRRGRRAGPRRSDPLIDRVDIEHVVEKVDVGSVAREAVEGLDLGEIVRESDGRPRRRRHPGRAAAGHARRPRCGAGLDRALGRDPRGAVSPPPAAPSAARGCCRAPSRT